MYVYICNDLGFLFFIQTFLEDCKALSTEKYKRYINIFILLLLLSISDFEGSSFFTHPVSCCRCF